jgi:hypothetical protein
MNRGYCHTFLREEVEAELRTRRVSAVQLIRRRRSFRPGKHLLEIRRTGVVVICVSSHFRP